MNLLSFHNEKKNQLSNIYKCIGKSLKIYIYIWDNRQKIKYNPCMYILNLHI